MAESVGERLRRLRLERGLSQRDLSAPGVSYAYISRIEAGARRPSVKALRMLAKKLGVTPGYLETGSDLDDTAARELRLADVELRLRLDGEIDVLELQGILDDATEHADVAAATRAQIAIGMNAAARADHAAT
ncbi:MAG: helix-turn-helix transcriptional regulator, partial [Actinobacteria bacterium]